MNRLLIKVFCLLLLTILLSGHKSIAQIDLSGKWTAYCVIGKPSYNAISFNTFCQYTFSEGGTEIRIETPTLFFDSDKDYFELITESNTEKVPYHIDQELHIIDLIYRETSYSFSILTVATYPEFSYILKSDVGGMVYLVRKEE